MNMIQKIRDSHLNRHGYIDVLIGVVVFQVFNFAMVLIFGNPENVKEEEYNIPPGKLLVMGLLLAPYFENLLMIGLASLHAKLFGRTGLFIVTPMIMAAAHFTSPHSLPFPIAVRALELFGFFYIYLKQYDLHKQEMGWHKALLLSSTLHFAVNGTAFLAVYLTNLYIDAGTIFSAQPGE